MHPHTPFNWLRTLPFLVVLAVIWTSSSRIGSTLAGTFWANHDKFGHFLAFGGLGATLAFIFRRPFLFKYSWLSYGFVITGVAFWGAVDELHQSFVPGRHVSLDDWFADVVGGLVFSGVYIFLMVKSLRKKYPLMDLMA